MKPVEYFIGKFMQFALGQNATYIDKDTIEKSDHKFTKINKLIMKKIDIDYVYIKIKKYIRTRNTA